MKRRIITIDLARAVAAQLGFKLLGFVVLTLLARGLSPTEFGFLMFALATCELVALPTEFGSSNYQVRQAGAGRQQERLCRLNVLPKISKLTAKTPEQWLASLKSPLWPSEQQQCVLSANAAGATQYGTIDVGTSALAYPLGTFARFAGRSRAKLDQRSTG